MTDRQTDEPNNEGDQTVDDSPQDLPMIIFAWTDEDERDESFVLDEDEIEENTEPFDEFKNSDFDDVDDVNDIPF